MEQARFKSEAEQLKSRISPCFLFAMLETAADRCANDRDEASEILMRLSRFLRYQLYDSGRREVLLNSEMEFLRNYLNLESNRRSGFRYTIDERMGNKRIAVEPLILFSVVSYAAGKIPLGASDRQMRMSVIFEPETMSITIRCRGPFVSIPDNPGYSRAEVRKRLELLFPDRHSFMETSRMIEVVFPINSGKNG